MFPPVVSAARAGELLRFVMVGFFGFCVDAMLLELFVRIGFVPAIARIFSIALALQVSYALHGIFTYRNHRGFNRKSWLRFMASNLIGAAINYGIFLAVLAADLAHEPRASRMIALVTATAITLSFNYWANRRFAFAHKELP